MKVTKVLYQKVFPLGQYTNEKIGVEIDLSAGDDENIAFSYARMIVDKWHKENNPGLYLTVNTSALVHGELPVIHKDEEIRNPGISTGDILSCNSLVVLDAYKGIIKDDEHLMFNYNKRRAELLANADQK